MINFNLLIGAHLCLAVLIQINSLFGTIHAFIVIGLGIYWSITDRNPYRSILVIFYITGAELLWRGFGANIFWEFGKYSTILIFCLIIYRYSLKRLYNRLGFLYILLLVPSLLVLDEYHRQDIAHAISGPICLGFAVIIFSNQFVTKDILKEQLRVLVLPIVSILFLMLASTIQHGQIDFYAAYVKEYTTAGVGPNQASNILGLGVFCCFLLNLIDKKNNTIYLILGLILLFQTVISHSRGGFWNALLAISISVPFIINERKTRLKFLFGILFMSTLLYLVIFPKIDKYSGGSISQRYIDTDLSQRGLIIGSELQAFGENLIFGIGPGQARHYRSEHFNLRKHTHTEYTRLLAEHGVFGIGILIILLVITLNIIRKNSGLAKSISLALVSWSLLFMFHSATRLVAPSIILGLSTARFKLKDND